MRLSRLLLFFVVLTGTTSALLLLPIPQIDRTHAAFFRSVGDVVFSRFWFWPDGKVRFIDLYADDVRGAVAGATAVPLPASYRPPLVKREMETLMIVTNRSVPTTFGQLRLSSRMVGYWPLAFMFALVLAKPLPFKRKLWAFALGLAVTEAFVLFRLTLHLADACFFANKKYALYVLGEGAHGILHQVKQIVVDNPTSSFVAPLLIWIFMAFTRQDWAVFHEMRGSMPREEDGDRDEHDGHTEPERPPRYENTK